MTFFGRQAKHGFQLDHLFIDIASASVVASCGMVDVERTRKLSDHAALKLSLKR